MFVVLAHVLILCPFLLKYTSLYGGSLSHPTYNASAIIVPAQSGALGSVAPNLSAPTY